MFEKRIWKLQEALKAIPCDAMLIDDATNLFYLTGLNLSQGTLLVHSNGANLIVDNRYFEICKKNSSLPITLSEQNHKSLIKLLNENSFIKSLGFSIEDTTYKTFLDLQKSLEHIKLLPINSPLKQIRSIKDEKEIELLKASATLGSEGFDFISTILKEGISEIEVAIELEIFWKRRGSKGLAFEPIIAFGANSSMPHYRAGNAKLKKDDIVLIDIGVNYQHYNSDMTRVLFFGNPDPELKKIYDIVKQAQQAALDLCKPGTSIATLDKCARDLITKNGYGDQFTHSLGHGIGLDVHEWPILRNTASNQEVILQTGMAITIEPGIYIPGKGGVRLENSIVISPNGYIDLTKRFYY